MEHCQIVELTELWERTMGDALDPLQVALWVEEGAGYALIRYAILRTAGKALQRKSQGEVMPHGDRLGFATTIQRNWLRDPQPLPGEKKVIVSSNTTHDPQKAAGQNQNGGR